MANLLDKLPAPLARRLRTRFGWHISRFAVAAIVSLGVTQLTLAIAVLAGVSGGLAALIGWLAGALTSYVLSRWAWQRKGRPNVVRETLPFWIISLGTAAVLTTTGHFASTYAHHHYHLGFERVLIVNGAVLAANAITFLIRFLIFHYVLFADREAGDRPDSASAVAAAAHTERPAQAGNGRGRSDQPQAEQLNPVTSTAGADSGGGQPRV
jgi:putative flippase GtrA